MAEETIKTLVLKLKTTVDKSSLNSAMKEIKNGLGEVGESSSEMEGASASVNKFTMNLKGLAKAASMPIRIALLGAKSGVNMLKNAVVGATKHITGFVKALGRIATYRMLRWALKEIAKGFQEGRQNAYQWAVLMGNQFAHSMDMIATSMLYLKNSIGAMTMPITNYLAPIIDSLIDKFVELINLANQFFATITGATSWVKALKYPAEYMEQAAGSAKELKNQLLGFDELNVLNAPRGGGSASALDYSNMFQQMELDANKFSFVNVIRESIKKGDWKGVGAELGRKFNSLIDKIDAVGLSEALGKKINNALTMLHTFLYEADFENVGKTITQFFTNLNLNWNMIGSHIMRWGTKLFDFIMGAIKGINWLNVGSAIGNFFVGAVNTLADFIKNIDWWNIMNTLKNALLEMLRGIPWWELAKSLANFFGSMVVSAFNLLSAPIRKIWEWITGMSSIEQAINNVNSHASTGTSYSNGNQGNAITGSGNSHQHGEQNPFEGQFASGGFPTRGTMFLAGEGGSPEFVGSIGGRTGVYNAEQMTVALATANEGVVETLAAVGNAIVTAINNKDTSINANDIRMAMRGMNLRYGV